MKLTAKITTLVTLVLFIILLIFTYLILENEKRFIAKLQDKQSKAVAQTVSTSIVDAVLLNDYPVMESVLEQTANAHENILLIEITKKDKTLAKYERTDTNSYEVIQVYSPVKIDDETIARVTIKINNEENISAINKRLLDGILVVLFVTILTLIVLIIGIKHFLIDKINYIKEETSNINLENLKDKIVVDTKDEFNDLAENINIMTEKLASEIEENTQKDIILAEQGKMAAMGEMMGNIAHQWRQPLSAISSNASSIKLFSQMGMVQKDDLEKTCDDITQKAQYLSDTIEIFRNFLKDTKEYKLVNLQQSFETVFAIVGSSLKNNDIELVKNIPNQNIELMLTTGEIEQVLINILNNAKDAIKENEIENGKILFDVIIYLDKIVISIEDNAGGIPNEVMPKIFIPYFTTKHESVGTGLGLHMSYKIVTESLQGTIYAKNTNDGAKFFIELPLKTS